MNINLLAVVAALLSMSLGCGAPQSTFKRETIYKSTKNEERVRQLQEHLKASPSDLDSNMELGRIYLDEGMVENAICSYEKVISQNPNNVRARLVLAIAYQMRERPNLVGAAKLLEEAKNLAPQQADIFLNLAQVYQKMDFRIQAIQNFEKALKLAREPDTMIAALLGLAGVYKRQGNPAKAQEAYDKARQIFPGIDDIVKQYEIDMSTPTPVYAGSDIKGQEGTHPHLEERAKRARERINKLYEGNR